ncbi:efflux RND transporter periplasmic adaptor subunit [Puniceicoccaceae bacterium K14]|nr:efflux RND transporter periplasmic adaptor subunit [Puniceicoccaceae bacterium K14]
MRILIVGIVSKSFVIGFSVPNNGNDTIFLTSHAVKNLGVETVEVDERVFETSLFSIGRLEEIPASRSVLSTRIEGRVVELNAFEGDVVSKGDKLVTVESRKLGDPPPTIELNAPQSGIVVSSHAHLGQPVSPDEEIMDIADYSKLWAVAKIPEQESSKLAIGVVARIHIPALGNEWVEATLTRFGVKANQEAGTIDGIFEIDNSEQRLRPGMRAEFSIVLNKRPYVLAVPRKAVQGDPLNRVLFVRDFEIPNSFVRMSVELGEENNEYVEVLSGLFLGDEVVTEGSYALSFSSSSSGMSLKEALDLAHGHEHNEDGSEMTEEDRRRKREAKQGGEPEKSSQPWLLVYAIAISGAFLITLQLFLKARKQGEL